MICAADASNYVRDNDDDDDCMWLMRKEGLFVCVWWQRAPHIATRAQLLVLVAVILANVALTSDSPTNKSAIVRNDKAYFLQIFCSNSEW